MSCWAGDDRGFADGELAGIGIPDVCIVWGEDVGIGDAAGDGITIPGVCSAWLGAVGRLAGLADGGLRAADFRFAFRLAFRLGVDFDFDLLTLGMVWPSCWASAGDKPMSNTKPKAQIIACLNIDISFFITCSRFSNEARPSYQLRELRAQGTRSDSAFSGRTARAWLLLTTLVSACPV